MNAFRFLGDMTHLFSVLVLLLKIYATKSCSGVSRKTQELYMLVFVARYLDLFTDYVSLYNSVMKVVFITSSAAIVWYMRRHPHVRRTYDKEQDTFRHAVLVAASLMLALMFHERFTFRERDGDIDADDSHRIKAGWIKWRQASGILCDKRVPQKLKGKFYRMAIRPAMLYGAECWPTKIRHVQQLSVVEMRVLRWICGHTRMDRVRNDDIRDRLEVAPIEEKLVQHRLRWFGHVQRRPPEAPVHCGVLSQANNMRRGRGRPKLIWGEAIKRYLKAWDIPRDLCLNMSTWKAAIEVPEP